MKDFTFKTADGVDVNLEKLSRIFPEVITETMGEDGKIKRVVDFEKLKMILGDSAATDAQEFYEFTWPGKTEAIMEAAKSTTKTLRPCPEESKNWDTTQNLYIEGDNLEVLKLLQESYLGKVKMIYIDPPYNTGKDFVYRDNFHKSAEEGREDETARDDETGENLFQNTESNGRFHSDWCSMIYPRLKLARDLLSDDGVIFISIDDNEVHNLRKICDEIFGAKNFYGELIQPKGNTQNDAKSIQKNHEYILVYAKRESPLLLTYDNEVRHEVFESFYLGRDTGASSGNDTLLDRPNLGYTIYYYEGTANGATGNSNTLLDRPNLDNRYKGFNSYECNGKFIHAIALMDYSMNEITGNASERDVYKDDEDLISLGYIKIRPPLRKGNKLGRWTWSIETFKKYWNNGEVLIKNNKNVIKKEYVSASDVVFENGKKYYIKHNYLPIQSILKITNSPGTTILNGNNGLIPGVGFDNPKNPDLIKYFCHSCSDNNALILDFFSGSATTAHACMQLNAKDGGNRKFIMVQLPEVCAPESEAAKAGYANICEIGKERIRRAGEKIKAEHATTAPNLDIGFRVLKLDESNMKDVYYKPDEISQDILSNAESNIKEDRNALDLLFACLIDWGVELSLPLKEENINGADVYIVNDGESPDLIACFSENIPEAAIREIARRTPLRVVFRDSSFADSPSKINVTEIFKTLSPNTTIKVL